jgi:spermidine synthase
MKTLKTRNDLLNLVPKNATIAEIGVFRGEFAKYIIQVTQPEHLYLVDIWQGSWGSGDKDGNNYVKIENMEEIYLQLFHQVKNKPNIHIVRSSSHNFLKSCSENYFDAVYVDGDHTEEAVYQDMVDSFRVVKAGGLLMGHDYHHQIKIAVDRFCINFNQKIKIVTDDGCPSFLIEIIK